MDALLSFQDFELWLLVYYGACAVGLFGFWLMIKGLYLVLQAALLSAVAPLCLLFVDGEGGIAYPVWVRLIQDVLASDMDAFHRSLTDIIAQFQIPYLMYFIVCFIVLFFFGSIVSTKTRTR